MYHAQGLLLPPPFAYSFGSSTSFQVSTNSLCNLHLFRLEPGNRSPCQNKKRRTSERDNTTEDLQFDIGAVLHIRDKGASNRSTSQGGERDNRKICTITDADFTQVRDLSDDCWGKRNEGTGAEAVQGAKDDCRRVAARGQPERQDQDGGEISRQNHHIEAAEVVGYVACEGSAEDALPYVRAQDITSSDREETFTSPRSK